ncbi:hypothetical protein PR202_ga23803 [Eleusine coracana subsp. coracana]|uniref:Uncharacterized protein n=1 Tax=Eleusine coracana subsp. coracana TaxID=191504 RepID=A0AAV5D6S5_ELECO|nr:hypothetical protein PR202_ga23803 [Eleusine coracana subsp. coracana]
MPAVLSGGGGGKRPLSSDVHGPQLALQNPGTEGQIHTVRGGKAGFVSSQQQTLGGQHGLFSSQQQTLGRQDGLVSSQQQTCGGQHGLISSQQQLQQTVDDPAYVNSIHDSVRH